MKNAIPSEEKIRTFLDAGSASLDQHTFVSKELNEKKVKQLPSTKPLVIKPLIMMAIAGPESDGSPDSEKADSESDGSPDSEKGVKYRLNQTGNIFYSTTSAELQADTKKLFDSVTVLFAAMTKALAEKKKDIFDYAAWGSIISKSGYFIEVQKFEKTLTIKSNSLTIDTQIVQQLLPGLQSGNSMEIAKSVLNALNGKYSSEGVDEKTKFGHLLFICEELFGAPTVTVRLFFASKESHKKLTSSSCHNTTSETFEQEQEANTFLFVSPDTIAEYADKFSDSPESYTKLVATLSSYID